MALTLLIVASETSKQQEDRRKSSGAASHETYAATLRELEPGVSIHNCSCIDGSDLPDLSTIDGVLYAGSPIDIRSPRKHAQQPALRLLSSTPAYRPSVLAQVCRSPPSLPAEHAAPGSRPWRPALPGGSPRPKRDVPTQCCTDARSCGMPLQCTPALSRLLAPAARFWRRREARRYGLTPSGGPG